MPALPIQTLVQGGVDPTFYSSSTTPSLTNGDAFTFPNNGQAFVHVSNGGTACIVTFDTPITIDGLAVANRQVQIPGNSERMIGPFRPDVYNNDDGEVSLSINNVVNVEIAIFQFP